MSTSGAVPSIVTPSGAGPSGTMPLVAVDAVVLDLETTGLDVARARVLEIGAVRLAGGRVTDERLILRVDPGQAVPAASTAVHGIDAAALAGAPSFPEAAPALAAFLGSSLVIGHSIGFDLAMLKREHRLAGLAWSPPRTLCTHILAELVGPPLPDLSLETIAAWLGVEVVGRHSAAGDAETTAAVFLALVPHLAGCGVRTVAEAEAASRRRAETLERQVRAGWVEPVRPLAEQDAETALARIDSYPYRHRVGELMSAPPVVAPADLDLAAAARLMAERRISSLVLRSDGAASEAPLLAAEAGILTERDILRAVAEHGAAALALPASDRMTSPVVGVPAEAFVYRAIGRMMHRRIRHLGVVDEAGVLVGALSARDLLRLRTSEAAAMGDAIGEAGDAPSLATAWARLPGLARSLLAEGVEARGIAAIVAREIGALTGRAAALAEASLAAEGRGPPPVPYAIVVLGSAGRGESLLAADQDNALVFASGEPDGPEDRWFAELGARMAATLDVAGLPLCQGGVMASNAPWRGSLATWRARVGEWVQRSRPEDLLSIDVFFDLRPVHGDGALARTLMEDAFAAGRDHPAFLKLLAETGGKARPAVGLFGRLKTEDGRVDLKRGGLLAVTSAARVLAIRYGVLRRSTTDRLAGVRAVGAGADADLAAWDAAQAVLLAVILEQQLADIAAGWPPGATVDPRRLDRAARDRLVAVLGTLGHVEETVRDLMFR